VSHSKRSRRAAAIAWRCAFAVGATVVVVAIAEMAGRAARIVGVGSSAALVVKVVSGLSLGAFAGYYSHHGIELIRRDLRQARDRLDR